MKNLLKSFVSLIVILVGCQHEEIREDYVQDEILTPSEYYGEMEDPSSTRTYLDGLEVKWSEGDEIVIFEGASSAGRYRINGEYVGTSSGYFDKISGGVSTDQSTSKGHNVAYYPYSEKIDCAAGDKSPETSYILSGVFIEPKQDYFPDSFHGERFPMVAVSSGPDDKGFSFRNLCGALVVQLQGTAKIMYMTLKGRCGEGLAGDAQVKCFTDGSAPVISMGEYVFQTVSLYCGAGVQLDQDEPIDFYIPLPPTVFKEGFTLTVYDSMGKTMIVDTYREQIIERSVLLRMPALTYMSDDAFDSPIDLSVNGTANSYIVSESGCYKIPAVKGNSDTSVGQAVSAEVIWESFGTEVMPQKGDLISAVRYEDGYLLFKTPDSFREGNALVALKDASGTILWSWHIWLVEDEIQEHIYANGAGIMMDRNLGATTPYADGGCQVGLLYQWGRKDPFMGKKGVATINYRSASAPVTIEYTIENPYTFVRYSSGGIIFGNEGGEWCTESEEDRWGTEKTLYDPCPAGWKVPDGGPENVWALAGLGTSDYRYYNSQLWVPEECSGSGTFYPFTESDHHIVQSNTTYSAYWTAARAEEHDLAYQFTFYEQFRYAYLTIDDKCFRDWRAAVRCYKIGSNSMGEYVPVDQVSIDYSSVELAVGENMSLAASVSPINATDRNVVWLSSDSRTASVSNGVITALKEGVTSVKAVCGGKVATCKVKVVKAKDRSLAKALDDGGESANCYIVSEKGCYSFGPFKGNSQMSVGNIASVEVLWESFGSLKAPLVGELLAEVEYYGGRIYLWTSEEYKEGNAVVAAKDADGNILWSWHIWLTDKPSEHRYVNGAGTLMDRNLGATATSPEDTGTYGLLYQWGRKDPFLGRASIYMSDIKAESSLPFEGAVEEDQDTGTIDYSVSHPTMLIAGDLNSSSCDWLYDESNADGQYFRWDARKTVYDPCPAGWRVASGGYDGPLYCSGALPDACEYVFDGMYVPAGLCGGEAAYFPASSGLNGRFLSAGGVMFHPLGMMSNSSPAEYWTVMPREVNPYAVFYTMNFGVDAGYYDNYPSAGLPVRCQKM